MTPLIREVLSSTFAIELIKSTENQAIDFLSHTFFDGGVITRDPNFDFHWVQNLNIPMSKCFFVVKDDTFEARTVIANFSRVNDENAIFMFYVALPTVSGKSLLSCPPFICYQKGTKLELQSVGEGERAADHQVTIAFSLLYHFQAMTSATGYQATPCKNSPTNKRRAKKGLPPLKYDWRTIEIGPKATRSESKGGTHASPRQHERRGHWRITKTGKRVWVRNCIVGDPSRGAVFHDYQITGVVQ